MKKIKFEFQFIIDIDNNSTNIDKVSFKFISNETNYVENKELIIRYDEIGDVLKKIINRWNGGRKTTLTQPILNDLKNLYQDI